MPPIRKFKITSIARAVAEAVVAHAAETAVVLVAKEDAVVIKGERFYPPPPPLRGTPPVSGVESVTIETPRQPIVPLRQGDEERSDGGGG